jgi:hypothetical protein
MPRGRKKNHDKHIQNLVAELRAALVAKEQARIQAAVEARVASLVRALGGPDTKTARARKPGAPRAAAKRGRPKKRAGRPSAGRLRQIAAMKAYWKKRRAAKAKPAPKAAAKK